MKNNKFLILLTTLICLFPTNIFADELETVNAGLCNSSALGSVRMVGIVIFIIKILVPIIIILLGAVDYFKAVMSGDDKAIPDASKKLLQRFIIGIVIFLAPTIVNVILNSVPTVSELNQEYQTCTDCLLDPYNESCEQHITNFNY